MMQPESHHNESQGRQFLEDEGERDIPEFPTEISLEVPPLDEIKNVLESTLKEYYIEASVSVVQCPDLRDPPFHLAAQGLCGNTIAMEIGNFSWAPYKNLSAMKSWHLPSLLHQVSLRPFSFVIGAHENWRHNKLREVVANFTYTPSRGIVNNNSYITYMKENCCESKLATESELVACDMHGTYFLSDGSPGNVLKVLVQYKRSPTYNYDFVTAMYSAMCSLNRKYVSTSLMALGGTFVAKNGTVRNVFRRLESQSNLVNVDKCVHSIGAPLVAVGTIFNRNKFYYHNLVSNISYDHFHTFAHEAVVPGGYFLDDITPNITEYEGYFNLASKFIYQLTY